MYHIYTSICVYYIRSVIDFVDVRRPIGTEIEEKWQTSGMPSKVMSAGALNLYDRQSIEQTTDNKAPHSCLTEDIQFKKNKKQLQQHQQRTCVKFIAGRRLIN